MKHTKRIFIISIAILLYNTQLAKAQVRTVDERRYDYGFRMYYDFATKLNGIIALKKTTLLVVLDDEGSDYSKLYKKAFEDYWKFTPYKFIESFQVIDYSSKPGYSFLMFIQQEYETKEV